jgi:hypothetical protein
MTSAATRISSIYAKSIDLWLAEVLEEGNRFTAEIEVRAKVNQIRVDGRFSRVFATTLWRTAKTLRLSFQRSISAVHLCSRLFLSCLI